MLRIGIKYCGGCNPGYERVEMVDRIQFGLNDQFILLHYSEPEIEAIVFMNGCQRACAYHDFHLQSLPHYSVTGENDLKDLMKWLASLNEKGDS